MIYTVTLNPSLDYTVSMDGFELGRTNRTTSEQMLPGGKGINVSIVLRNLGFESTALGFTAGFTGEQIAREVQNMGLRTDFIHINSGCSRINVKLKDYDGTEINGMGPAIESNYVEALHEKLKQLKAGDLLVLAGSIPKSLPAAIYSEILMRLQNRGILFVVDATKELLLNALQYKPFLIKPNNHELGELFHVTLDTREAVVAYAKKLQKRGREMYWFPWQDRGRFSLMRQGRCICLQHPVESLSMQWGQAILWLLDFSQAGWRKRIMNMRSAWELPRAVQVLFLRC